MERLETKKALDLPPIPPARPGPCRRPGRRPLLPQIKLCIASLPRHWRVLLPPSDAGETEKAHLPTHGASCKSIASTVVASMVCATPELGVGVVARNRSQSLRPLSRVNLGRSDCLHDSVRLVVADFVHHYFPGSFQILLNSWESAGDRELLLSPSAELAKWTSGNKYVDARCMKALQIEGMLRPIFIQVFAPLFLHPGHAELS